MIEVSHLTKKYGAHRAVNDLSFQVEDGQVYGLLGKNGAGKSTTMNIMTGYLAATQGTVTINGHDILKDAEEAKRCIGYLPEIPPLYDSMTVREYLVFVAELKQIKKEERQKQIEEIMELTGIKAYEGRLISNLSKGFKQRVGLAQAVLGYPPILILDEPMVGLDPKQMIEIRELIRDLSKKHTIILSSHILSEVSAVCDHILIIADGRLVACDTTENLETMMDNEESKLKLSLKGEREKVEDTLKAIDGVREMKVRSGEAPGLVTVELMVENGKEIREEVFFRLSASGLPIYGMELAKNSLEDVFLALTDDSQLEELSETEQKQVEQKEEEQDAGDL